MSDTEDHGALVILRRLEPALGRIEDRLRGIEDRLLRIETVLPNLATAADLATKPGRGELWAAIATLLALFAAVLAAMPYVERHLP